MKPTHRQSKTRLYRVWKGMRERCRNPNNVRYANYGGRGITVCEEWSTDFTAFQQWALENGYKSDAAYGECTLDRIDVDGNYSPDNCRFIPVSEQTRNQRKTIRLTYNGQTHDLQKWSEIVGISAQTLRSRYWNNWPVEKILFQPLRKHKEIIYNGKHYDGVYRLAYDLNLNPRRLERFVKQGLPINDAIQHASRNINHLEIEWNGETHSLKHWSSLLNIPYITLYARIAYRGWTIDRAFSEPVIKAQQLKNSEIETKKEGEKD